MPRSTVYSSKKKQIKPINIKKQLPKTKKQVKHVEKFEEFVSNCSVIPPSQQLNQLDILEAINYIKQTQWTPIPHDYPQDLINRLQLFKSSIPRSLVSKFQIYATLSNNETFVDQEIDKLTHEGLLFRVIAQDDITEWIIPRGDYLQFIQCQIDSLAEQEGEINKLDALIKYQSFLQSSKYYTTPIISTQTLIDEFQLSQEQISTILIQREGYLEILPKQIINSTMNSSYYYVKPTICKIPNILKILTQAETFIKRNIAITKFKELKIQELQSKWNNFKSNKARFTDFKSVSLQFILLWLIGKGTLECFESRDGSKVIKLVNSK
ncbi:hypothetical protein WICPIJ_001762 [Wickerhamomyces pijperi]|uniref:Uncharacterized protein n=1 Tax=Wickerhamomyces pijperi TaxID=599730 RepID=A0A9P8TQT9_WICPI|nr:hypothetical protein WICPIJ_001762 [Wickerhamomyces pijperi]